MALSRRAKIIAGAVGLTATALFTASGSALAADGGDDGGQLVIVDQHIPAAVDTGPGCDHRRTTTATVADTR
ncbi:MAG TPA: hypothetical protein VH912_19925 [Streptosporangiaceae bacterium]|jgi:hypothetical protein